MLKTVLAVCFLVVLPLIAQTQGGDPKILTTPDAITLIQPITDIGDVQPCGAGSEFCQFDFSNNTGAIIDSLTFDVTFADGIPQGATFQVSDPNIPASENCGGYFLVCTTTVDGNSVIFSFSGVNPPDGDETPGQPNFDQEIGEQEGIPPTGDFFIDLEGWTNTPGGPDYFDGVSFQNSFTTVPEASSALILLTELLLLAGVLAIFRRRLNWKRLVS